VPFAKQSACQSLPAASPAVDHERKLLINRLLQAYTAEAAIIARPRSPQERRQICPSPGKRCAGEVPTHWGNPWHILVQLEWVIAGFAP